jgi:O-antigen/teichoic acid export membrane protein
MAGKPQQDVIKKLMSLSKQVAVAVVVQGVGVGLLFLTTIIISRDYGPEGQGFFSSFKSWIDFFATVGLFGFPQAIIFAINTGNVMPGNALKASLCYFLLYTGVLSMPALLIPPTVFVDYRVSTTGLVMGAVAASLLVLHGLVRSIALTRSSPLIFNLVTAAPSIFTFLALLLFLGLAEEPAIPSLMFCAALAAAVFSLLSIRGISSNQPDTPAKRATNAKEFFAHSLWAFVATISMAVVPAITYHVLNSADNTHAQAGYFSVAFVLASATFTPLNMIAPVMYNSWVNADPRSISASFSKLAAACCVAGIVLPVLCGLILPALIPLIYGEKFSDAIMPCVVMLSVSYFFIHNRLLVPLLLADGNHRCVAIANVLRAGAISALLLVSRPRSAETVVWFWLLGELLFNAYLVMKVREKLSWRLPHIYFGLTSNAEVETVKGAAHERAQRR